MSEYKGFRTDKLKGCGAVIGQDEESNYPIVCDGWKLCNGVFRLCKKCSQKNIKDLRIKRD